MRGRPDERAPLPAVVEVLLVVEHEAHVVLAAHQDDGGVRAELPHLSRCNQFIEQSELLSQMF